MQAAAQHPGVCCVEKSAVQTSAAFPVRCLKNQRFGVFYFDGKKENGSALDQGKQDSKEISRKKKAEVQKRCVHFGLAQNASVFQADKITQFQKATSATWKHLKRGI